MGARQCVEDRGGEGIRMYLRRGYGRHVCMCDALGVQKSHALLCWLLRDRQFWPFEGSDLFATEGMAQNCTELQTLLVPPPFELFQPQAEASATQKKPNVGQAPSLDGRQAYV